MILNLLDVYGGRNMAPRTTPAKAGLDLEILGKMTAPITVHVTRVRGGNTQLIVMPPRDGHAADGTGWEKSEISTIDGEIVEAAGGGGLFEIQLSDSSNPPIHHKYRTEIPLEIYPMAPKPPYPYDGQMPPAGWGSPYGPPNGWGWGPQPPANGWGARTPIGGAAPAGGDTALRDQLHQERLAAQQREFEFTRRFDAMQHAAPRTDDRYEREREERLRAEREAAETRARADREAADARHRADIDKVMSAVTQLAQTVANMQTAPKGNDEIAELKAELKRSEERRAAEAQLAEERRRSDAALTELHTAMTTMQQQMQLQIQQQKPSGPDPMIMMLIEWMKMNAQANAEAARLSAETAKEEARTRAEEVRANTAAQAQMMEAISKAAGAGNIPPLELMRMLREAGSGADQLTRTMVSSMTDMMELQRNATANLLSMAPQGEGVAGRIVGAIENGIEKFSDMQQATAAAHANAQATVARANADAMMAQAAMSGAPGFQPPPGQPFVMQQQQPIAGAPPATPIRGPIIPPSAGPPAPDQLAAGGGLAGPPADPNNVIQLPVVAPIRHGKTDAEWFGPALPKVMELREAVGTYLTAVDGDAVDLEQLKPNEPVTVVDEQSKPIGASPFAAADYIVKAAGQIIQLQQASAAAAQAAGQVPPPLGIPAFEVLFAQQMFPALVDVLLPDPVPQEYRVNVITYLHRHLTGQTLHSEVDPPLYGIAAFMPPPGQGPAPGGAGPRPPRPPKGNGGGGGRARA